MNVSPLWVSVFPGGWYKSVNCSWFGCLPQLDCLLLLQCLQDMKCVSLWPCWGPYITPNALWEIFRFWCGACTRLMDGGRAWPWRSCWFTLCWGSCIGRVMDHPCAGPSLFRSSLLICSWTGIYTELPALHRHPREILGLWAQNPSNAHTKSKQRGVYTHAI